MESTQWKAVPEFTDAVIRSLFAQTREAANGCWEWIGYRDTYGYGVAKVDGVRYRAHRVFVSAVKGELDPGSGMVLDHLCRNRACVNPHHLEQVSQRTNSLRGVGPAAENATKTHCPEGHEYNEANTYKHEGRRACKLCKLKATREWRERNGLVGRERTHCKNGHPWTPENIRISNNGKVRRCYPCSAAYEKERNLTRSWKTKTKEVG